MTKEQWIEGKYKQVDQLPSEYAIRELIKILLEEVWELKQTADGKK